jgi:hypothetical protein
MPLSAIGSKQVLAASVRSWPKPVAEELFLGFSSIVKPTYHFSLFFLSFL